MAEQNTTGQPADTGGSTGHTPPGSTTGTTADTAATAAEVKKLGDELVAAKAEAEKQRTFKVELAKERDALKARVSAQEDAMAAAVAKRGEIERLLQEREAALAEARKGHEAIQAEARIAQEAKAAAETAVSKMRVDLAWKLAFIGAGGNPSDLDVAGLIGQQHAVDGKVKMEGDIVRGVEEAVKALKEGKPNLFGQRPQGAADTGRATTPQPKPISPIVAGGFAGMHRPMGAAQK